MTVADPIHDQAFAAFDEAHRLTGTLPGAVSVEKIPTSSRVLSAWFNGGVWTSCGHLPTPQVCFGLAHLHGYLMCADCLTANAELADNSCDWCHGSPPQIFPIAFSIGPAVVIGAMCHNHLVLCHDDPAASDICPLHDTR